MRGPPIAPMGPGFNAREEAMFHVKHRRERGSGAAWEGSKVGRRGLERSDPALTTP